MCRRKAASQLVLISMGSSCHTSSDSNNSTPAVDESNPNLNPVGDGNDESLIDSYPSDSESAISGPKDRPFGDGVIRIDDQDLAFKAIEKKLVLSLSGFEFIDVNVEGVYRIDYSEALMSAKLHSFDNFARATGLSRGGDANVKNAWYGGSKDEIVEIISNGFGVPTDAGINGLGLYLSPFDCPIGSVRSRAIEEDGLRHMLLCRVILGRVEVIYAGSRQSNPSSEEFDSGVDNLMYPQKYIIWGSRVNTHILPEFMVSFRASLAVQPRRQQPRSDWMTFANLVSVLSRFLRPEALESVIRHHNDFRRNVISRVEMVQRVRKIAGDKLLMAIIRRYGAK